MRTVEDVTLTTAEPLTLRAVTAVIEGKTLVQGLDLDASLTALAQELGGDFVDTLVHGYLAELPARRASLVDARRRADGPALKRLAHLLQGESGTLGARRLVRLCAALQQAAATDGDLEAITAAVLDALDLTERTLASFVASR